MNNPDAIVIGAGLSGLVTACELADAGKRVVILDQEPEQSIGGQAFWSFGGLFFVDSPEQRRFGIEDSHELARKDWLGSAGFDREDEDLWGRRWADEYLAWVVNEKRAWVESQGVRMAPTPGWAERAASAGLGVGNSVPRFHVTWGTGPGLIEPFIRRAYEGAVRELVDLRFRHRVEEFLVEDGAVVGVRGVTLADDDAPRGAETNRERTGDFELRAASVVIATGGIGANHELVKSYWPKRMGSVPKEMIAGVPAYVDGELLPLAEKVGARLVNRDRMWHCTEGLRNWAPIWRDHGIRILPGPSSLWFDATGKRFPDPIYPGFDTLGALEHIVSTGHDYSWFVLDQRIVELEFGLSGSEQNLDMTNRNYASLIRRRTGAPLAVQAFLDKSEDFVQAATLDELFAGMRRIAPDVQLDAENIEREIRRRDDAVMAGDTSDGRLAAIARFRAGIGARRGMRIAEPHRLLDPESGPLIAVKLHLITRKSLGGIQTDLGSRALGHDGQPVPGLYAVGEAAGFGGGGMHGYRALEGTFLGGCLFTGINAARSIAAR